MRLRFLIPITLIVITIFFSCERDEITTSSSSRISFSVDTLSFDTVFTTIGSATRRVMIYNRNDKPIIISSIKIAGGNNSPFFMNVDGSPSKEAQEIRIESNDSTYVFVQVNIDPTNINSPLLIEDSLLCESNGNRYSVNFRAFGQDVHLLKDSVVKTQTWINDKPYLIIGNLVVDENETLTIESGTTIYIHRNPNRKVNNEVFIDGFFIVDGTILVNGTKEKPVVFRGDRLDNVNYSPPVPYDKIPGQWGEIWIRHTSKNNILNYAYVRNAQIGMVVGVLNEKEQAQVELYNCRFENHSISALYGQNSKIKAVNSIFANTRYYNFATVNGGEYEFYHCTFGNYTETGKGVYLSNFAVIYNDSTKKNETFFGDLQKAYFGNCIIFGTSEDQLEFNYKSTSKFEYTFDHCLIRGNTDKLDVANPLRFIKQKIYKDLLKDLAVFNKTDKANYNYDWTIPYKSLARDIGSLDIAKEYPFDFNGNPRTTDLTPDAGAFEYVAETTVK